eukprot:m.377902 g.377902  ORF g.377902 m.377902 type:complete len:677 (+) comp16705_c4_seq62:381-2411(+)
MMIQGWTPPPGFGLYPSTWYGSFCRVWDGLKLMAGGHTPAPRPVHRANFPTAGDNDMEVEIANAPPSTLSGAPSAGLPMFSPVDFFRDNNGHMCDVNTVNSHTVVLGRSGEGKTHLTVHLIMQWANVKGWSYGWVGAIMPRATWDGNLPYHDLLDESQVFFLDNYPSKKDKKTLMERIRVTVADNRRNGVPSLLLVDDCVPQLLNANLPIMELMTNGRTMWLTVISLWQTQVRSGMVGNVIRSNATVVVFFKSMIASTVKKDEWVAHDDSRHTEMAMQTELRGHTAGVILPTKNPSLYKMQAPETYPVVKIGRPDLKGKLVDLSADNDTAQPSALQVSRTPRRPPRNPTTPICKSPPGCTVEWHDDEEVYRCTVCGHIMPFDDDDYHDGNDDDDDDDDWVQWDDSMLKDGGGGDGKRGFVGGGKEDRKDYSSPQDTLEEEFDVVPNEPTFQTDFDRSDFLWNQRSHDKRIDELKPINLRSTKDKKKKKKHLGGPQNGKTVQSVALLRSPRDTVVKILTDLDKFLSPPYASDAGDGEWALTTLARCIEQDPTVLTTMISGQSALEAVVSLVALTLSSGNVVESSRSGHELWSWRASALDLWMTVLCALREYYSRGVEILSEAIERFENRATGVLFGAALLNLIDSALVSQEDRTAVRKILTQMLSMKFSFRVHPQLD